MEEPWPVIQARKWLRYKAEVEQASMTREWKYRVGELCNALIVAESDLAFYEAKALALSLLVPSSAEEAPPALPAPSA